MVTGLLQWSRQHSALFEERRLPASYEEIEVRPRHGAEGRSRSSTAGLAWHGGEGRSRAELAWGWAKGHGQCCWAGMGTKAGTGTVLLGWHGHRQEQEQGYWPGTGMVTGTGMVLPHEDDQPQEPLVAGAECGRIFAVLWLHCGWFMPREGSQPSNTPTVGGSRDSPHGSMTSCAVPWVTLGPGFPCGTEPPSGASPGVCRVWGLRAVAEPGAP